MNLHSCAKTVSMLLLLGVCLVTTAWAQEEASAEAEGSRLGHFYSHLETWVAQPAGLRYTPATRIDSGDGTFTDTIEMGHGTTAEMRYQLDYELPSEWGTIEISLYKHEDDVSQAEYTPGLFGFGETLTYATFAGVENDGLADGFASTAHTELRDLRFDFSRAAFRSPRVAADWFVGWRRTDHSRDFAADYYALVPDFPPLLPPAGACPPPCKLDPLPDRAVMTSSFEGRGPTVGIDLEFPLWKNKVVFEADLALSVMRGEFNTRYNAENSLYMDVDADEILDPPYDEFDDYYVDTGGNVVYAIDSIEQQSYSVSLDSSNSSASAQVYESSLGFRWRTPWKRIEVYGGFRIAHYNDIAVELRPKDVTYTFDEDGELIINIGEMEREALSATYEGFYGGLRLRLY